MIAALLVVANMPAGSVVCNTCAECQTTTGYAGHVEILTDVVDNAFYGCAGLTSVLISPNVTSIGYNAFRNCGSLTTANIGAENIGASAFFGCSNLTAVTIASSVRIIGSMAFFGCPMASVYLPHNVTTIGSNAFPSCYGFGLAVADAPSRGDIYCLPCAGAVNMEIPPNVTSVGDFAFHGCASLESVVIPDSVTSIGEAAFIFCSSLELVVIPNGVTSIGPDAFSSCSSLASVAIPTSVTSIGETAFQACSSLASVVIPSSVTSIGAYAFSDCGSLTSFDVPGNISFGEYPFYNCGCDTCPTTGPAEIVECSHVVECNNCSECEALGYAGHVRITENPAPRAFKTCSSLRTVRGGPAVETIADGAFDGCGNLTSVSLSAKSIGRYAFAACSLLRSVDLGTSIELIGEGSFQNCRELASIEFPPSLHTIGLMSFSECYALTTLTIANTLTSLGEVAFYQCTGLTTVSINTEVISKGAFSNCYSLALIDIGDSVRIIKELAFAQNRRLVSIEIPHSVETVENDAFRECGCDTCPTSPGTTMCDCQFGFGGFHDGECCIEVSNADARLVSTNGSCACTDGLYSQALDCTQTFVGTNCDFVGSAEWTESRTTGLVHIDANECTATYNVSWRTRPPIPEGSRECPSGVREYDSADDGRWYTWCRGGSAANTCAAATETFRCCTSAGACYECPHDGTVDCFAPPVPSERAFPAYEAADGDRADNAGLDGAAIGAVVAGSVLTVALAALCYVQRQRLYTRLEI